MQVTNMTSNKETQFLTNSSLMEVMMGICISNHINP